MKFLWLLLLKWSFPHNIIFGISLTQLGDCIITAIGVGSGTANSIVPILILVTVFLCTKLSCLVRTKLIKDVYTSVERERALCHLATHLLAVRPHYFIFFVFLFCHNFLSNYQHEQDLPKLWGLLWLFS